MALDIYERSLVRQLDRICRQVAMFYEIKLIEII